MSQWVQSGVFDLRRHSRNAMWRILHDQGWQALIYIWTVNPLNQWYSGQSETNCPKKCWCLCELNCLKLTCHHSHYDSQVEYQDLKPLDFYSQVVHLSGMMTSHLQSPIFFQKQPVIILPVGPVGPRQLLSICHHPLRTAPWSRAGTVPPTTRASPSPQPASLASPSPTSQTPTLNKGVSWTQTSTH